MLISTSFLFKQNESDNSYQEYYQKKFDGFLLDSDRYEDSDVEDNSSLESDPSSDTDERPIEKFADSVPIDPLNNNACAGCLAVLGLDDGHLLDSEQSILVNNDLYNVLEPHQKEAVKIMYDSCWGKLNEVKVRNSSGCVLPPG